MKELTFFVTILCVVSCSSIVVKQTSPLSLETLFIAEVVHKQDVILDPNESKSGRVLVGLLSAGIIVGQISVNGVLVP